LLAGAIAGMLALSASQLYLTWLVKLWADELLARPESSDVARLTLLAVLATLAIVSALFASRYWLAGINLGLVQQLRDALQARILRADFASIKSFPAGDLVSRMFNDAGAVSGFTENVLTRVVGEGFLALGAVALMFYLAWRLAFAALLAVPVL